jgi:hypothetical protein
VAPCWMEVEFVPAGRAHRCLIRHARPRVESLKKNRSWGKRCKCFCLAGNGRRSGWWRADFGLQQLLYSGRQLSARSRCLLGIPPKTWHGSSCETKYSCFFSLRKKQSPPATTQNYVSRKHIVQHRHIKIYLLEAKTCHNHF